MVASIAVALLDDGNDIFFDELAGIVAYQPLVVAEQRIEVDEVDALEFDCHKLSRLNGKIAGPTGRRSGSGLGAAGAPTGGFLRMGQTFEGIRRGKAGQT